MPDEKEADKEKDAEKPEDKSKAEPAPAKNADDDVDYETWLESLPAKRRKAIKAQATKLSNFEAELERLKDESAKREKADKDADEAQKKEQGKFESLYEESQAEIKRLRDGRLRDRLKLEAQAEGILDPEDLDSVTLDGVEMREDGTIAGAKEFVKRLKGNKSHWFKSEESSSADSTKSEQKPAAKGSGEPSPAPSGDKTFDATKITDKAEYEQVKRDRMAALAGKW